MSKKKTFEEVQSELQSYHPTLDLIKEIDKTPSSRKFIVRCNVCNQTFERALNKIKQGCPYCSHNRLAVGVNDMATTAPWMVEYLKDKEDAHRYAKTSNKKIVFKCPDCGYERLAKIDSVYANGFSCDVCSDDITKPNKFMRAVLSMLPLDNLEYEYCSKWTQRKRYDAYFEYNGEKYVVEMDGSQHKNDTQWGSYEQQKANDDYKDQLARNNQIHMIRIYAPDHGYELMEKGFIESPIGILIQQSDIDWNECIKNAQSSIIYDLCKEYDKGESIINIANTFHLDRHTVRKYLMDGAKLGICSYHKKIPPIKDPNDKALRFRSLCSDLESVENYSKAKQDDFVGWRCHHRLATHFENGNMREKIQKAAELKEQGLYYDRPPCEFIFLPKAEQVAIYGRFGKGRKATDEARQKQSEAHKKLTFWTNGKVQIVSVECPEGFVKGKLPHSEEARRNIGLSKKGVKWWTNGTIDKFCKDCPDGYYAGRSNFNRKGK